MSKEIVVVDDDVHIRTLLEKLLSLEGYDDVVCFETGLQAIDYLCDHRPDLIFLDVEMPRMDGWLLCEILHNVNRWKRIPVVFQSALRGAVNIKRGIALGAHSYLEKPYTSQGVKEVLDGLFAKKKPKPSGGVPAEARAIIEQVSDAIKQTFNLMLGAQTQIIEFKSLDATGLEPKYDFVGTIPAVGVATIEISMAWARGLACSSAMALMQLEEDELDDELVLDSMQEILNMVLGQAIRTIGKTYPVKLALPKGAQNAEMPFNAQANHQYRLDVKAKDWLFPVVATLQLPQQ